MREPSKTLLVDGKTWACVVSLNFGLEASTHDILLMLVNLKASKKSRASHFTRVLDVVFS